MARLFHAGAEIETRNTSQGAVGPEGSTTSSTTLSRDTSVFRSGVASWKCDSGATNVTPTVAVQQTVTVGNSYFLRGYFRATAAPGTAAQILNLAGTAGVAARLRTDGAVELLVGSVVRGSPSAATITDSNWHRIELKQTVAAGPNITAAELLVDGVSAATFSGSVAGGNGFNAGWIEQPGANKIINVDDIALNDSTGAVNNTYPGSGKVILLSPISDNARGTGWTGGAGGTTNLFAAVDNTPPVGVADAGTDTSQIRNATSNANVNYDANMTSYTTAGITTADTINALIAWVATAAPVTTNSKQGLVGLASNPAVTTIALSSTGTAGAFWAGAAGGTFGTGWKWSPSTMTETPSVTLGTSPVMRITQVTANTRIAMVCGMFVYVEYTPPSRSPRNSAIDLIDPAFV